MMAFQLAGPWTSFSIVMDLPILNFNILTIRAWLFFTDILKSLQVSGLRACDNSLGHLNLTSWWLVVSISWMER